MAKLTKKKLVNMDASEIGSLTQKPLRSLIRQARELYERQAKTFSRYEGTVYSPALEGMEDYFDEKGKKAISRMKMNEMRAELFKIQDFFKAKTSTVPGARKVAIEQDINIFGVNEKTGRPNHRMTIGERTAFWSAYNEFTNMETEGEIRGWGSNTIQQYLGQIMLGSESRPVDRRFTADDFVVLKLMLESTKNKAEWEKSNYEYGEDDVFSR